MVLLLRRLAVALAGFAVTLGAATVVLQPHGTRAQAAASDFCTTNFHPLTVKPTMPPVFPPFQNGAESFAAGQATADCQAWQQFIYMNWPALPSPQFGIPNPKAPFGTTNVVRTVWVSYNRPVDIFVPNAPTKLTARPKKKVVLSFVSEPLGNTVQFSGSGQAFTGGWIVGQKQVKSTDGKLTYSPLAFYDVWVDRDEQDYTWSNQLQYAVSQNACAVSTYGFNLPKGQNDADCYGHSPVHYGLGIGAVEVKAALLDLGPAPLLPNGNLDAAKASKQFPTYFLFPVPGRARLSRRRHGRKSADRRAAEPARRAWSGCTSSARSRARSSSCGRRSSTATTIRPPAKRRRRAAGRSTRRGVNRRPT